MENDRDYDHVHHESYRQRFGTSDFTTVEWTKAICEVSVAARKIPGALISFVQILVLGIIQTAVAPLVFLIGSRPPTPPSMLQCNAALSVR